MVAPAPATRWRPGTVALNGSTPLVEEPAVNRVAVPARVGPTMLPGYPAAHESPSGRCVPGRSTCRERRAAAGVRRDAGRRPNPPTWRQSARRVAPDLSRLQCLAAYGRQDRAAPRAPHISPSRRIPVTAACGYAREAPPTSLSVRSGRERAATLAATARHDGTPGPGPHPQAKAMHAGAAPVVRLESPFALGHGVLLVVSR